VRRILKSKWEPSQERKDKLVEREKRVRMEKVEESKRKELKEADGLLRDEPEEKRVNRKGDRLTLGQGFVVCVWSIFLGCATCLLVFFTEPQTQTKGTTQLLQCSSEGTRLQLVIA